MDLISQTVHTQLKPKIMHTNLKNDNKKRVPKKRDVGRGAREACGSHFPSKYLAPNQQDQREGVLQELKRLNVFKQIDRGGRREERRKGERKEAKFDPPTKRGRGERGWDGLAKTGKVGGEEEDVHSLQFLKMKEMG